MDDRMPVSFGDRVRVRTTPETESRGVADMIGLVYGETTPSVTGVTVIGEIRSDYAVNVHFEGRKEMFWFAPELLEYADQEAGTRSRDVSAPKEMKLWFKP